MTFDRTSKIGIIGSGSVGGSIAIALSKAGYRISAAASRSISSAEYLSSLVEGCVAYSDIQEAVDAVEVVFVTTPDDAVCRVVESISWASHHAVIHCSGAKSLDVLTAATLNGASPGAFHPLQAFYSAEKGASSIAGITFAIEGSRTMRSFLSEMAKDLKARYVFISAENKVLYHLSAVMMGNLLTEYVAICAQLWEHIGLSRIDGLEALLPMMNQVSDNLESAGLPDAIGGPFVRGDIGTIKAHLHALSIQKPDLISLYCELALMGLNFAEEKQGIDLESTAEIRRLLKATVNRNVG